MLAPSVSFQAEDPIWKPPPWIHTITGSLAELLSAGVQTFRYRQSSLRVSWPPGALGASACMHESPNLSATFTPCQGSAC